MNHNHSDNNHESNKYNRVPDNYKGTVYVCPMHTEVREVEDNGCPICGMHLKPEHEVKAEGDTQAIMTRITAQVTALIRQAVVRLKTVNTISFQMIMKAPSIPAQCIHKYEMSKTVAVRYVVWH